MSLFTSLYTGTSGLQANSLDLAVIGDNIANANTIGFKAGRSAFEDVLAQSFVGGGQTGLGVRVNTIQQLVTQGALTTTGLATDLAMQGSGYFVVRGAYSGQQGQFYTRAGQFTLNQDGYLVNLDGLRVQGYSADGTGAIGGALGDMRVGDASTAPRPTSSISMRGNLQSDAVVGPAFDPANPNGTSNFSSSATIFDSLGQPHNVDVFFRKAADGQWEYHALTDGSRIQGGVAGTPVEIGSGTLTYDASGNLVDHTQTSNFNPIGAVNPQALEFNFGDPLNAGGTGVSGMTQYGTTSATSFTQQDGYASGTLSNIQINTDGQVIGTFSNGQTRALAQVAVANFEAPDKLNRVGGTLLQQSSDSGESSVGLASTGGRGSVVAGALEQSNVDIATEFVRMIAAQRGFQANSKTISTADSLLAELIQLKR